MASYQFDVSDCDVVCKTNLERFREKRTEWLEWLDDDPVHAITKQLHEIMWNDVTYRTFNEGRRFAFDEPTAAIAPLLAEFIDVGYIATQVLAVSKLIELNPTNRQKAVISLRRLVDDISTEIELITRENFVAHDGLPYDFAPVKKRDHATVRSGTYWKPQRGPDAWYPSERRHQDFDRLSGITPAHRSRNDQVRKDVFDRLLDALQQPVLKEILLLRHKIVAHAADPANRRNIVNDLTLGKIAEAHKILLQVAQVVSSLVLCGGGVGTFPHAQFDQLQYLDTHFVLSIHIKELRAFWDAQEAERNKWIMDADKALLPL
jgi:hypothetical protein